MSSAILYLAIIAIWACFLVPAWVRRPHAKSGHPAEPADWYGAVPAEEHGDGQADEYHYEQAGIGVADARARDARVGSGSQDGGRLHGGVGDGAAAMREDTARAARSAYVADFEPEHGVRPGSGADFAAQGASADEDVARLRYGPSQSRVQMLRARRRMLTILVTMTAVTGGFAFLGVVGWWICAPPAGMLVLYVLLLREIAMADAELARKRQAQAMRAAHAEAVTPRAHSEGGRHAATRPGQGTEAGLGAAEPTAQIIDISGRVGDQLYDQYADAAARAVGD